MPYASPGARNETATDSRVSGRSKPVLSGRHEARVGKDRPVTSRAIPRQRASASMHSIPNNNLNKEYSVT